MIDSLKRKVLVGGRIDRSDAAAISGLTFAELPALFAAADEIRRAFRNDSVDLCAIINAKSGACPEDCSYCAQSSKSKADIQVYPLINEERLMDRAREAKDAGVKRFCIVTSGRKAGKQELEEIGSMITGIRKSGLLPCSTLGLMNREELSFLKDCGLERYHHNIETSERFFPEICRTHTYYDKLKTIEAAKSAGLSVCSGGIFGMGETWEDRIDMAFAVKELDTDSVPVNFLVPVKGTSLAAREALNPLEALKIISLYRFILPAKEIRVCGGRIQTLRDLHSLIFMAGADSLLTGNYLTTTGRNYEDDLRLIGDYGLII